MRAASTIYNALPVIKYIGVPLFKSEIRIILIEISTLYILMPMYKNMENLVTETNAILPVQAFRHQRL